MFPLRAMCVQPVLTNLSPRHRSLYIHSLTDAKYLIGSQCVIYRRVCAHFRRKQERSSFIMKITDKHYEARSMDVRFSFLIHYRKENQQTVVLRIARAINHLSKVNAKLMCYVSN